MGTPDIALVIRATLASVVAPIGGNERAVARIQPEAAGSGERAGSSLTADCYGRGNRGKPPRPRESILRKETRRLSPAGFSWAFAARGTTLTSEPFNPTFLGADGTTGEPN